jgi:hypothetical protein
MYLHPLLMSPTIQSPHNPPTQPSTHHPPHHNSQHHRVGCTVSPGVTVSRPARPPRRRAATTVAGARICSRPPRPSSSLTRRCDPPPRSAAQPPGAQQEQVDDEGTTTQVAAAKPYHAGRSRAPLAHAVLVVSAQACPASRHASSRVLHPARLPWRHTSAPRL